MARLHRWPLWVLLATQASPSRMAGAAAPPVDLSDLTGSEVQAHGVKGDGETDVRETLSALAARTGRRYQFGRGTYRITSNLSLPNTSAWYFAPGARLRPMKGVTITLPETVEAGPYPIFDFSGGGAIRFSLTPTLRPEWFGARPDGKTDSTLAFKKAIEALCHSPATNGTLLLGNGVYRITDTLTVFRDRIHIRGEGKNVSVLQFDPAGASTLLEFKHPSSALYQCSLKGVGLRSADTAVSKVAISLVDIREITLNDVAVHGSGANGTWSGGGNSIGLKLAGRDTSVFDDLTLYADRPIVFSPNTRSGVEEYDGDSMTFRDLYLVSSGMAHPIIEAQDGVSLTNVQFEGRQSWAFGRHGFHYVSRSHTVSPYSISIKNVRWEQSTSAAGHAVHIDASGLHNLRLENVTASGAAQTADRDTQGFYFRNAKRVRMESCMYTATRMTPELNPPETLVALDVDHTVEELALENCFFNAGTTLSLGGLILAEGRSRELLNRFTSRGGASTPYLGHYTYQRYVSPASPYQYVDNFGVRMWSDKGRLASGDAGSNSYSAGTATVKEGGKTVTLAGKGAAWIAEDAGKVFLDPSSTRYLIDSVFQDTSGAADDPRHRRQLTLKTPYPADANGNGKPGETLALSSYRIMRARVLLPILNSYTLATVYVTAVGPTKTEQGVFVLSRTGAKKTGGTADCDVHGTVKGNKLFLLWESPSQISILNQLGETVEYLIRVEYQ